MAFETVARPRGNGGAALPDRARAAGTRHAPHILHVLPGFGVGGIQMRLARVINALGGGFSHAILSLNGDLSCADRIDPGGDTALAAISAGGGLFRRLREAAARIGADDPDLLATYNWGAIEWAMANRLFARRRHIHFEDGFGPEEAENPLRRRSLLRRWALGNTEAVIVPSRTLEAIARAQWKIPPDRLRYIPNGIAAEDFALTAISPAFARRKDETVIGTVAPLRPEKNLARLIDAFASLPESCRLVIAGDGPERTNLEARARALGLGARVLFLGAQREPQRALAGFDVFALSSDTEQMPMTVLEAMAAGLPVAATDVGDVKAMLAPENRPYVAAKGDTAALAAALAALVADPVRRRDIGGGNQAHARAQYPWRRMADSYAALFEGRR